MVWNILLYYADVYFTNRLKSDHLYITYVSGSKSITQEGRPPPFFDGWGGGVHVYPKNYLNKLLICLIIFTKLKGIDTQLNTDRQITAANYLFLVSYVYIMQKWWITRNNFYLSPPLLNFSVASLTYVILCLNKYTYLQLYFLH